jgi:phage minor structural protein
MNVTAEFPFDADKVIQFGQRIAFRDPATDTLEVFEIVNVVNQEPDHYQQITAEHICIAELSDEHINKTEITDKTAVQALTTALTGTLWSVGDNSASGTQSADLSRGSVWDAVNAIQQNWNVYITPRVTISSAGAITGRYLDIAPAQGTWRGLRLSVRKNLVDPAVTYDDSEVYTALFGYGGSVDVPQQTGDDKTEELTFKDVVWTATSEHPAKPSGQTYLEWPEKTAIYGRNGRPRYGYYQNANIKDAAVLLQKTWESLQKSCEPKISISGTCVDFYRLGYKDQPIRLHDMAIVEIEETGELLYRQVICNDVDLVDPSGTRPDIGDYIPNIVYINRDTNTKASGGGGGGGGGRGSMTNLEDEDLKWYTEFIKTQNQIGMVIRKKNGTDYIDAAAIALSINESTGDTTALIKADHVNISATNTAHLLAGSIFYDANGNLILKESSGGGIIVEHNKTGDTAQFGIWDKGNLTGGVMVQQINGQTGTKLTLTADVIDIDGIVTALAAKAIGVGSFTCEGLAEFKNTVYAEATITAEDTIRSNTGFDAGNNVVCTYQSTSVITSVGVTKFTKDFRLADGSSWNHSVVTDVSKSSTTLNYLGS